MYRGNSRQRALVALAAVVSAATAAATFIQPALAAPDTETVTPFTVAFGTVQSESGVPVAGASVYLVAERSDQPSPGRPVELPVVAEDVTDATGDYILNLPPDFVRAGAVDPSTGLATFDVIVHSDELDTLAAVETPLVNEPAKAGRHARPRRAHRVDFGGALAKTEPVDSWSEAAADFVDTQPSAPTVVYPQTDDGGGAYDGKVAKAFVTVVRGFGGRWTAVGAWFSNTRGVNATFDYSNGASSSLGVGVSDTAVGGFHADSTQTESTNSAQGFPTKYGEQSILYRTLFTYKEFKYRICGGRPPGPACFGVVYKVEPVGWRGGSDIQQTGNPGDITKCVPELNNARWHRGDTQAITWTNGVSLKVAIGIDLSSQTGYTSQATLDINFTEGGHQLCGRGSFPGRTPYVLMARP
jgi:hypothetical protein